MVELKEMRYNNSKLFSTSIFSRITALLCRSYWSDNLNPDSSSGVNSLSSRYRSIVMVLSAYVLFEHVYTQHIKCDARPNQCPLKHCIIAIRTLGNTLWWNLK